VAVIDVKLAIAGLLADRALSFLRIHHGFPLGVGDAVFALDPCVPHPVGVQRSPPVNLDAPTGLADVAAVH
jgi:hypothetical protein